MSLKKIDDADVSFKRWPRTMTEAFGPDAKLTILKPRHALRDRILAYALFALIGVGWYVIVGIKAGAQ
ncbi:hypothetical protein C9I56_39025 [Paraburkholderia caribensis]|uniref:hypothetical protein n=1 Tax=Paraburkholderia caribensis TaxID=75105 RepID=UPI000D16082F|nr:hypothetical protein [Paraburkholderia caribensis]PTB23483.1 hypothetical protein C9I56_39025 [Paraburkholderia caribensis]